MARFLPVSLTTILVELADLDETLALFAALQADPIDGIAEMVPAARTLMIGFRPEKVTPAALAARIATYDLSAKIAPSEHLVEIPVRYDGEDLPEVAERLGISVQEVIARHTGQPWQAAFAGFAPGFVYLAGGHPCFQLPRRSAPRSRPSPPCSSSTTASCMARSIARTCTPRSNRSAPRSSTARVPSPAASSPR